MVYIGPLKALVRERLNDWAVRIGQKLKKRVVELTGDYTPNVRALQNADVVLTTPGMFYFGVWRLTLMIREMGWNFS